MLLESGVEDQVGPCRFSGNQIGSRNDVNKMRLEATRWSCRVCGGNFKSRVAKVVPTGRNYLVNELVNYRAENDSYLLILKVQVCFKS